MAEKKSTSASTTTQLTGQQVRRIQALLAEPEKLQAALLDPDQYLKLAALLPMDLLTQFPAPVFIVPANHKPSQPLYQTGQCLHSALFNQAHCYADKQLQLVIGSLGVGGSGQGIHWEYGEAKYDTVLQFKKQPAGVDAHAWLQDPKSDHIYDCPTSHLAFAAEQNDKRVSFVPGRVYEDCSVEYMKSLGLHYLPAQKDIQDELLQIWLKSTRVKKG